MSSWCRQRLCRAPRHPLSRKRLPPRRAPAAKNARWGMCAWLANVIGMHVDLVLTRGGGLGGPGGHGEGGSGEGGGTSHASEEESLGQHLLLVNLTTFLRCKNHHCLGRGRTRNRKIGRLSGSPPSKTWSSSGRAARRREWDPLRGGRLCCPSFCARASRPFRRALS